MAEKNYTNDAHITDKSDQEELRTVFSIFDKNGDGKISSEELQSYMAKLGYDLTDAELISMMSVVDKNQNGVIEFEEFLSLYEKRLLPAGLDGQSLGLLNENEADDESLLKDTFRLFDKDHNGFITAQELQSIFSNLGLAEGVKLADCYKMIRGVDLDGDGQVSFPEFQEMMKAKRQQVGRTKA